MNSKVTREPDWSLLRAFLEVAEHGSLSRAAAALGSSQPTLSRQIAQLEAQLGHALFERTTRGVTLTEAGAALAVPARRMREQARELGLVAAGRSQALAGTVRVTASEIVSAYLLPDLPARPAREPPGHRDRTGRQQHGRGPAGARRRHRVAHGATDPRHADRPAPGRPAAGPLCLARLSRGAWAPDPRRHVAPPVGRLRPRRPVPARLSGGGLRGRQAPVRVPLRQPGRWLARGAGGPGDRGRPRPGRGADAAARTRAAPRAGAAAAASGSPRTANCVARRAWRPCSSTWPRPSRRPDKVSAQRPPRRGADSYNRAVTPYRTPPHDLPRTHDRTPGRCAIAAARTLRPDGSDPLQGARDDRHPQDRRRRPLFPVHPQRGLEPGRRHRQERQLRHRPGRGRARGGRREDRLRLLRRHHRGRPDGRRGHGPHHRRRRPEPQGAGRAQAEGRDQPRALCADGSDRDPRQHPEGGAAREGREARPLEGPAHRPGDGRPGRRVRRGDGRARRRHARCRRAPAGAPLGHRDRRADDRGRGPPRSRFGRRRRPLRLRLLPRRDHRRLRAGRRQRRAHQPRIAPGQGRRDERGARAGLAGRAAARGDRPRPGRRLQPQGFERVQRPPRPARRGQRA